MGSLVCRIHVATRCGSSSRCTSPREPKIRIIRSSKFGRSIVVKSVHDFLIQLNLLADLSYLNRSITKEGAGHKCLGCHPQSSDLVCGGERDALFGSFSLQKAVRGDPIMTSVWVSLTLLPLVAAQSCLENEEFNNFFIPEGAESIPLEGSCCMQDVCGLPCPAPVSDPSAGTYIEQQNKGSALLFSPIFPQALALPLPSPLPVVSLLDC